MINNKEILKRNNASGKVMFQDTVPSSESVNNWNVLALFLFEDGVSVGLLLVKEFGVVELGGQALGLALPLGDDLALLFGLFVRVVELLFDLLLHGDHLLEVVLVLLDDALLGQLQLAVNALVLLPVDARHRVVVLVAGAGRRVVGAVEAGRARHEHLHLELLVIARHLAKL